VSFAHVVEHMASALALAKRGSPALVGLEAFDCAQAVTRSYVSAVDYRYQADPTREGIFADATPRDLGEPVRYALLTDLADRESWQGYFAIAARQLSFREMRGQPLPFATPWHCALAFAAIERHGVYASAMHHVSWHTRERRWLAWRQGVSATSTPLAERMELVVGAQFTARYDWHVDVGLPDAPRVSIPCKAEEARELFATRDLPPGKERRAALLHWVQEHYRRKGEEAPVHVRPHLRGATEFAWESMTCAIRPSAFDRDKANEAKAEKRP
jgi:hypothetical protein